MIESPINSVPMQRGQALSVEFTIYSQHVLPCIHDLIAEILSYLIIFGADYPCWLYNTY